jgi:DNA polymerase-4
MDRYAELSGQVMGIFSDFTPEVRRISVDEAFLGMTGTEKLWGPPEEAAKRLKARVSGETGLTISVGVAGNHYIAKIASGLRKPDGLVIVKEGEEEIFMLQLPLSKLWGAGEKTQERFRELGIDSVARLASLGRGSFESLFGKAGGAFLHEAVHGRDPGMFGGEAGSEGPGSRSMSGETTFERDTAERGSLESVLMGLADELAYRLWSEGFRSRTLVLKLRFHDFSTITRRSTKASYYLTADEAFKGATELLGRSWDGRTEIRLIGLGFADLEAEGGAAQGELFSDGSERRRKAQSAVFEIERKGLGRVTRARLLGSGRRGPISP